MPIMASVAINGCTRPTVTTSPLKRPQPMPTATPSNAAGTRPMAVLWASTTDDSAITAATDRSKPPETTTMNWPTERMPSRADWVSRLLRLRVDRNTGEASAAPAAMASRMKKTSLTATNAHSRAAGRRPPDREVALMPPPR